MQSVDIFLHWKGLNGQKMNNAPALLLIQRNFTRLNLVENIIFVTNFQKSATYFATIFEIRVLLPRFCGIRASETVSLAADCWQV